MRKRNGWAVITGASSGIGTEFAIRLAQEGFPLVLVARREDRLKILAECLEEDYGTACEIVVADLAKVEECRRLFEELRNKQLSVMINNAGFGLYGSFEGQDLEKELGMIDVNVRAVHVLTKLSLQKMEKQHGGYLLNVASSAGLMPAGPYMSTYYATKAYVASLTRAVSEELRENKSPVYVGVLCPGPVKTEFDEIANVQFSLDGITAEYCANYAVDCMKRRKPVIIPTLVMKMATTAGRLLPQRVSIRITSHQQKKKNCCPTDK